LVPPKAVFNGGRHAETPAGTEPWADQDVGGGLILEESESPRLKDWVTETKETPCNFASYGNLLDPASPDWLIDYKIKISLPKFHPAEMVG
jgi:hypothetical protein